MANCVIPDLWKIIAGYLDEIDVVRVSKFTGYKLTYKKPEPSLFEMVVEMGDEIIDVSNVDEPKKLTETDTFPDSAIIIGNMVNPSHNWFLRRLKKISMTNPEIYISQFQPPDFSWIREVECDIKFVHLFPNLDIVSINPYRINTECKIKAKTVRLRSLYNLNLTNINLETEILYLRFQFFLQGKNVTKIPDHIKALKITGVNDNANVSFRDWFGADSKLEHLEISCRTLSASFNLSGLPKLKYLSLERTIVNEYPEVETLRIKDYYQACPIGKCQILILENVTIPKKFKIPKSVRELYVRNVSGYLHKDDSGLQIFQELQPKD